MCPLRWVGLVDCNNFFVSCERLRDPSLEGLPVVVLSNNDGCIISRSNEAKALGIPMGAPLFKVRPIIQAHGVRVFSSNFRDYLGISHAVMAILREYAPRVEQYSIDEAFLDLTGFERRGWLEYGHAIREHILQDVGVPVSIGIAPTKTLAKIAVHLAKTEALDVVDLPSDAPFLPEVLRSVPVHEVWGVGWRLTPKLKQLGVFNADALRCADEKAMMSRFGTPLGRTIYELRGLACYDLESARKPRQSAMFSRSFGQPVYTLPVLREAVASYTSRAAEKLRYEGLAASGLTVFIQTSRFVSSDQHYRNAASARLLEATDVTSTLTQAATALLEPIFASGYAYKKAGVLLWQLLPADGIQRNLFCHAQRERQSALMTVCDRMNQRFGAGALHIAAEGISAAWQVKREFQSEAQSQSNSTSRDDSLFMSRTRLRFM